MKRGWVGCIVLVFGLMSMAAPAAAASDAWKNTLRGLNTYMSGVAAVKKRDYAKGIARLSSVVDTYSGAKWQEGAHYWLAYACLAHDNPKRDIEKSQVYFRRLLKNFPKSSYRWDAENYLKLIDDVLQPRREVKRIKEEMLKE